LPLPPLYTKNKYISCTSFHNFVSYQCSSGVELSSASFHHGIEVALVAIKNKHISCTSFHNFVSYQCSSGVELSSASFHHGIEVA
jgi:hypothetical protein